MVPSALSLRLFGVDLTAPPAKKAASNEETEGENVQADEEPDAEELASNE